MKKRNAKKALPKPVVEAFMKASPSLLEGDSHAASAPVTEIPQGKRISHLKLGPALLIAKATPEQIRTAFMASFNARGVTEVAWIEKRIKIYMEIARKKLQRSRAMEKTKVVK